MNQPQLGLTPEQIQLRRQGIGASEVAAILGRSKYATPIDVFRRKTDKDPEQLSMPWLEWGQLLEPAILAKYSRDMGVNLATNVGTVRSKVFPHLLATPDALVDSGNVVLNPETNFEWAMRAVDAKALRWDRKDEFGETGTDEIPDDFLVQLTVQMGVFEVNRADLAVLFGGDDFRIFSVRFNPALFHGIGCKVEEFWSAHVETKTPPPLEASESYAKWLAAQFPRVKSKEMIEANEADLAVLADYRRVKGDFDRCEAELLLLKNSLKARIGEKYGIRSDIAKAIWTGGNPTIRMYWEELAEELLNQLEPHEAEALKHKHSHPELTARQLRVTNG